jgi:hypothetical protein
MNPMKRLGLTLLLVVGVTLLASTPARASENWRTGGKPVPGQDWGTIQLTNIGDEPAATGGATLTEVRYLSGAEDGSSRGEAFSGTLSVSCQNLTPGATYWSPAGTFNANRKGQGRITGNVVFMIEYEVFGAGDWKLLILVGPYVVDVDRLNADGSRTPVLTGVFVPPGATY